jgi:O-methyltransferase
MYLDLLKKTLTRVISARGVERHTIRPAGTRSRALHNVNRYISRLGLELVKLTPSDVSDYLESGHAATNRVEDAETMLGIRQLDQMQDCIRDVLNRGVPGDLLEAGVWRGGMTIFMRGVLKAFGDRERKVWVVDSFAGLPRVNKEIETFDWAQGDMAVSLDEVKNNFTKYGLLDDRVEFVKGYFSETLPQAQIGPLAVLRVDADLYQSTLDVLRNLYSHLSIGGYAVFDDYYNLPDCNRAIHEFRQERGIASEIVRIDGRAVYWRKTV